jgi:hypothetical protein
MHEDERPLQQRGRFRHAAESTGSRQRRKPEDFLTRLPGRTSGNLQKHSKRAER